MGPARDGGPLRYSVSLTRNPPRGLTGPKLRPSNSWWCLKIVLTFGDRPQPDCVASRHGRVMARPLGVLAPRHLLGVSPPPIYNPPSIEGQVAQLVEQRTENPRVGSSILPLATPCVQYAQGRRRGLDRGRALRGGALRAHSPSVHVRPLLPLVVAHLAGTVTARGQAPVDPALAHYIAGLRAIDNHAHPMRPVAKGELPDTEYDALPLDGIPPFPLPWRLTLDAPVWSEAAQALYGPRAADTGVVAAARLRALAAKGRGFPSWALHRAGIDVMLANRIALGPGLSSPRFRWVPFDDALLFPLDTRNEAARSPDTRSLYPREAALLRRFLKDLGFDAPPATLDDYVTRVVVPTLRRQREAGAVAIKFEAAYLRALDFDPPDSARAVEVYARYAAGGAPSPAAYKALTAGLFRIVARAAGRLGLAVHLHVLETFGGFYQAGGARPGLLESALNDSTLRSTKFVIIHGGWPHVGETEALLGKPNVYADISMMDLMLAPAELAQVLRHWLTRWPDKVLFGTDAFEGGPNQGWEEGAYVAAATARRALGIALTAMVRDRDIGPARARLLARMVLRDNAAALYHLGIHS